jgi:thiosulfate/3-mercaptopyruvate sulfurtransferase
MTVSGYATDVLVDADWATSHLTDPTVRLVEVDVDTTTYEQSHIPGAASIPWAQTVREDGTFKSRDELANLYEAKGITSDKDVIAYCRIGERSSHSWFVLHELLGYKRVRNYDGSWTEYGSLIGVPIEKPLPVGVGV